MSSRPKLHERLKIVFKDTKFKFTSVQSRLSEASKHFHTDLRRAILIADLEGDLGQAIAAIEALRKSGFVGAIITLSETLDETSVRGLRPRQRHPLAASGRTGRSHLPGVSTSSQHKTTPRS